MRKIDNEKLSLPFAATFKHGRLNVNLNNTKNICCTKLLKKKIQRTGMGLKCPFGCKL